MTSTGLVTIGMPVRNGAAFIARALDSLLTQSWSDIEIVVSDNGSTDDTEAIVTRFAKANSRLRYIRQVHNIGASANFEFVLRAARGDYFMWAAADDVWDTEFVRTLREALEANLDSDVAMSAVRRFHEGGGDADVVAWKGAEDPSNLSYLSLATRLVTGKPYHLFIYGLYRTSFLLKALEGLPGVVAADRLLVCQNALATKFRYVDQVLHHRQIAKLPLQERYHDEDLGKIWQDPRSDWKLLLSGTRFLARSRVIPLPRKAFLPVIVAFLFVRAATGELARVVRKIKEFGI